MRPAFISSGAPSGCLKALMIGCLMTSACLAARSPVWLMILSPMTRVPQRCCNRAVGPCRNKGKVARLCQERFCHRLPVMCQSRRSGPGPER